MRSFAIKTQTICTILICVVASAAKAQTQFPSEQSSASKTIYIFADYFQYKLKESVFNEITGYRLVSSQNPDGGLAGITLGGTFNDLNAEFSYREGTLTGGYANYQSISGSNAMPRIDIDSKWNAYELGLQKKYRFFSYGALFSYQTTDTVEKIRSSSLVGTFPDTTKEHRAGILASLYTPLVTAEGWSITPKITGVAGVYVTNLAEGSFDDKNAGVWYRLDTVMQTYYTAPSGHGFSIEAGYRYQASFRKDSTTERGLYGRTGYRYSW
jgi:hypothetical protein